ncbi:unnamed protein product [Trichogramma brassicae]|uniref:Uncharacterized protein n=1 Tax=Trichogramma brassicae TaxID=86971 RepID=A0A6H5I867_9HYME|nr:unnamed protein product [Trichogramma brassicae]
MSSNDESDERYRDHGGTGDEMQDNNSEDVIHLDQDSIVKLKSMREKVNWKNVVERNDLLDELYPLVSDWKGQLPNLRDIFRPEEIDWILIEDVMDINPDFEVPIVDFVIMTGYKDEPEVGKDGKPSSCRTTALHHATKCNPFCVKDLFKIYNRFDVNYTNESGLTHFHVACKNNCYEEVEKFIELGQDPNCPAQKSVKPPLHMVLKGEHVEMFEFLLRQGANPNLPNKKGFTLLHDICQRGYDKYMAEMLFEFSQERYQPVQVDARDKYGETPLHLAVYFGNRKMMEMLLRKGADANSTNNKGSTPLHTICKGYEPIDYELAEIFFKINDELQQTVLVDARDQLGRTPLQLAVANLMPHEVDALLDNGADISSFVFPISSYYAKRLEQRHYEISLDFKLRLASGALIIIESLEKKGYELNRSDALTIMILFVKYRLLEKSADIEKCYNDEEFTSKSKHQMVNSNLSLYDLIRLRTEKVKNVLTPKEYFEFAHSGDLCKLPKGPSETCAVYLCEMLSRTFFRRWALGSFLELTRYRLPILCCDTIFENLKNEDLRRICLAATGQSS